MAKQSSLKRNTSIHEAGHALAAVLNGATVTSVGLNLSKSSQRGITNCVLDNGHSESGIKIRMQIAWGSCAALKILEVDPAIRENHDTERDKVDSYNIAAQICVDDGFPDHRAIKILEQEMFSEVYRKLSKEIKALRALALAIEALPENRGVLTGEEVHRIISENR